MSIYGEWKNAVITIATSTTVSAAVDLGRDYDYLQINIPTIDSANVGFQVCETTGGTYKTLGSGNAIVAAGTGGFTTTVNLGGYQFIKVTTSAAQTANRTFVVRGSRP
jgi:hypothetical protein